jgi:hypothetical protein
LFDLITIRAMVGPGIRKILGPQGWIRSKQVGFAHAHLPGANQDPDGDAGANDARLTAADIGPTLNAGKVVTHRSNPADPVGRVPTKVRHGNDNDFFRADSVEDTVRKAVHEPSSDIE